jgi:adenosylcobinamide-GDP ribazoletransferase
MKNILYQIAAAITFFTRIPIWKIMEIPVENYRKIICFWPLTGWITGAITALSWLGFSHIFPPTIAIVLALAIRVLLTGGFHEDGLGDFFDGFGGGKTKADILRIMKDSHVGSYALIGIIFYYLLLINMLISIPKEFVMLVLLVGDPLSKFITSIMMNLLSYARTESESKSKTLYDKLSPKRLIVAGIFGILPTLFFLDKIFWICMLAPIAVIFFMLFYSKKKIGGYTGDICGVSALLCELSFYVAIYLQTNHLSQ